MKRMGIAMAATAAGSLAFALPLAVSEAAVRTCTARLTSIAAKDASEQGAKKKAIDDWMLKAKGAGVANPAWRLAAERRLICQAVPAGASRTFECIAVGHACSVTQVAPKPDRRSRTPAKGFGIDT